MKGLDAMHARVKTALYDASGGYRVHMHETFSEPIRSPSDFARVLGYDPHQIAKSLLVKRRGGTECAIVVCSAQRRVDGTRVAEHLHWERMEIASREELATVTGYPPTGVTPLGVTGVRILLDQELLLFPAICVGAGVAGCEVELDPRALQALTKAESGRFAIVE